MEYYPRDIVTQQSVDYKKDCRAEFGSYVEVSTYAMVTNYQTLQTHRCVALGYFGNIQESLKCFDLKSGKVVMRRVFKVIPMPDRVVKLVNDWGMQFKKENNKNKLFLLNRHGKKFDWYNEDLDYDENVKEFH